MSYWDTSCLVKLYVAEPDSATFESHALHTPEILSSEITRFELQATLRRKEAKNELATGTANTLYQLFESSVRNGEIRLVSFDVIRTEFETLLEHLYGAALPMLRTLDAIHLATARTINEPEIAATDTRLRETAAICGFRLYPPLC